MFAAGPRDSLTPPGPAGDAQLWHAVRLVRAAEWAQGPADGWTRLWGAGGQPVG